MRGEDVKRDLDRIVLDHLPVLAAYLDREERYRFANETYAAFFGRTVRDIIGVHIADLLGPVLYADVAAEIQGAWPG